MPQTTESAVHFPAVLQREPNVLRRALPLFLPPSSWGGLTQCGALLASWLLFTGCLYCTISTCEGIVGGCRKDVLVPECGCKRVSSMFLLFIPTKQIDLLLIMKLAGFLVTLTEYWLSMSQHWGHRKKNVTMPGVYIGIHTLICMFAQHSYPLSRLPSMRF